MPSRSILNILNLKDVVTTEDVNILYRIVNGMYDTHKAHGIAVKLTAFDGRLATGQIDTTSYALDVRNRELSQQKAFAARDGNNSIIFDIKGGKTYASGNVGTAAANEVIVNGTNAGGVLSGTYPNPAFASPEYVVFQPKMLMQWYGAFSTTSRADGFGGFNAEVTGAPGWVFCNASINVKMRDGSTVTKPDFSDYIAIGPGTVPYTTKNTPITWASIASISIAHTHPGATHTHTLNGHTHDLVNHTHGLNSHVHDMGSHLHDMGSHDHTMQAHVHSLNAHVHGINSHNHGMNHTHDVLSSHTHTLATHDHTPGSHTHSIAAHYHSLSSHKHAAGGSPSGLFIPAHAGTTDAETTTGSNIIAGANPTPPPGHTHNFPNVNLFVSGNTDVPTTNWSGNSDLNVSGGGGALTVTGTPSANNTGGSGTLTTATAPSGQTNQAEPYPHTSGFMTVTDTAASTNTGISSGNTDIPSTPNTSTKTMGNSGSTSPGNTGVPDAGHASTATPSTNSTGIVGTGSSATTDTSNNTAASTGAATVTTINSQPPVLAVYWIMKL